MWVCLYYMCVYVLFVLFVNASQFHSLPLAHPTAEKKPQIMRAHRRHVLSQSNRVRMLWCVNRYTVRSLNILWVARLRFASACMLFALLHHMLAYAMHHNMRAQAVYILLLKWVAWFFLRINSQSNLSYFVRRTTGQSLWLVLPI